MKQFYEKVLPKQGVYCAGGIATDGKTQHRYAETVPALLSEIEKLKSRGLNVYITPATFTGYRRVAKNCAFVRSFFIDLDVGDDPKKYPSKDAALEALQKFLDEQDFPPPIYVDSGTGIHAYWVFDEDIPSVEWVQYARKFKDYISAHLKIDPVCTADMARFMRAPGSFNLRHTPPREVKVWGEFNEYDFAAFKELLGAPQTEPDEKAAERLTVAPLPEILRGAQQGADEDTKAVGKPIDENFDYLFETIAEKSLEGGGCNQIRNILINAKTLSEPLWFAGLGVAQFCADAETAIHKMSEDYDEYTPEATNRKVYQRSNRPTGPTTCVYFASLAPEHCEGCPHRGKITTPKQLGKVLRVPTPQNEVRAEVVGKEGTEAEQTLTCLPDELFPFTRAAKGGIYFTPPPKVSKEGVKIKQDPIRLTPHDLYPVKRMYSPLDGECLTVRNLLPKDPHREFLLPMKSVYAADKLREILASNSVFPEPNHLPHFMSYFVRWGQHLLNIQEAETMRMQMGWTETKNAFVVGNYEIRPDGTEFPAPASPYVKGIAKLLEREGTFDAWKRSASYLDQPGFEVHAFIMLCGFGSPLMHMTSTTGVTLCMTGSSGAAKTGAMYGALSVWGHPKGLSVLDATDNGFMQRYIGLHNLPFGLDEVSNREPKEVSYMVHRISQGKGKIRLQASVNAERLLEMDASMIAIWTSNQSMYDKLEQFKENPDGEAARLIEIDLSKPAFLIDHPEMGEKIFDTFRHNYGWAGPEFIKHIYKYDSKFEQIKQYMDKWRHRFHNDFGYLTEYRFYENLIQAAMTAGEVARDAGIVSYDLDRIYNVMMHELISIRDRTVKVNRKDYKAVVGEFMLKHHAGALILNDGKVVAEPRLAFVMRIVVDEEMCYVSKTEFKKFLAEKQIGSRAFEKALEAENMLAFNGRQRLSTGWRAGMNTPPIAVYGFKADIPEEIFSVTAKQV